MKTVLESEPDSLASSEKSQFNYLPSKRQGSGDLILQETKGIGWEGYRWGRDTSRKEVQAVHSVLLGLIKYSQGKKKKAILESFLGIFLVWVHGQNEVTCGVLA